MDVDVYTRKFRVPDEKEDRQSVSGYLHHEHGYHVLLSALKQQCKYQCDGNPVRIQSERKLDWMRVGGVIEAACGFQNQVVMFMQRAIECWQVQKTVKERVDKIVEH